LKKQIFPLNDIYHLKERSVSSIKMKVQNIASMLAEEGFDTHVNVSHLSGKTTGEIGRRTNWDIVEKLAELKKVEFSRVCETIIQIN
jgi:hypothetical protein